MKYKHFQRWKVPGKKGIKHRFTKIFPVFARTKHLLWKQLLLSKSRTKLKTFASASDIFLFHTEEEHLSPSSSHFRIQAKNHLNNVSATILLRLRGPNCFLVLLCFHAARKHEMFLPCSRSKFCFLETKLTLETMLPAWQN